MSKGGNQGGGGNKGGNAPRPAYPANKPSTTGQPSGPQRTNAPPKK